MNPSVLIMLVLMIVAMVFMTRSQKKQQQQRQELLNSMTVGDQVITIGGLHGVVSEVNKEVGTVVLDCEGIFLEFNRSAIASVKPAPVVTNDAVETSVVVEETKPTTNQNEEEPTNNEDK